MAIRDRNGNQIELIRTPNTNGPVTKIISPSGRYISMTLENPADPNTKITSATDNMGRTVLYEYETTGVNSGRLKKVTLAVKPLPCQSTGLRALL